MYFFGTGVICCVCLCICACVCVFVRVLSVHVSGMNNLLPSLRQNLPITPLHHLSSLSIHEFLCLQGCDWLLMNN